MYFLLVKLFCNKSVSLSVCLLVGMSIVLICLHPLLGCPSVGLRHRPSSHYVLHFANATTRVDLFNPITCKWEQSDAHKSTWNLFGSPSSHWNIHERTHTNTHRHGKQRWINGNQIVIMGQGETMETMAKVCQCFSTSLETIIPSCKMQ